MLRFLDGWGVEVDIMFREKGRDFVSVWLSFLLFFSIAFITARLPPSAATTSYRALRSIFFFSAVRPRVSHQQPGREAMIRPTFLQPKRLLPLLPLVPLFPCYCV
jgi:hypothetical protein